MNLTIAREILMFGYRVVGPGRSIRRIDKAEALRNLRQSPILSNLTDKELGAHVARLYPCHKNHRKDVKRYKISIPVAERHIAQRGVKFGGIEKYVLLARKK